MCDRESASVLWVEAEEFDKGPGWGEDVAFVEGWKGDGYLVDSYGSQAATYESDFDPGEQIYAWVRFYKRVVDKSPALLRLEDEAFTFADSSDADVHRWVWERVGPFDTRNAEQHWRITRPYREEPARLWRCSLIAWCSPPTMIFRRKKATRAQ
jgi:hypothetical protein